MDDKTLLILFKVRGGGLKSENTKLLIWTSAYLIILLNKSIGFTYVTTF